MKTISILAITFLLSLSIKAQDITGQWNGVLKVQGAQLRLVLNITKTENGFSATMDSPDQGAKDIPVTTTTFENSKLKLEIPNAKIEYNGEFKENIITGTFKQNGQEFLMDLSRKPEESNKSLSIEKGSNKSIPSQIETTEIKVNPLLNGTLFTPKNQNKKPNLVILIAGSGPTDRNGNQIGIKNNSLKFLSEELAKKGIAVFSYDKRIIAQIAAGTINEKELSFDDFINDAKTVISYFKSQKKYNKVIIAGHSEGSLIGMVAANGNVDGYISLAGAGRPIDVVIAEQIEKQVPTLKEEAQKYFEILKKGKTFELKNQELAFLFKESVQPYMISWMKYNSIAEIKKLKIPILIINGTKDLQVQVLDAELLKQAKPDARLEIITNMNHILKEVKANDDNANLATYSNPEIEIMPELVSIIYQFIKSI